MTVIMYYYIIGENMWSMILENVEYNLNTICQVGCWANESGNFQNNNSAAQDTI